MENAMKLLEQSGQAEPRTIAMILTSAAEGYIERRLPLERQFSRLRRNSPIRSFGHRLFCIAWRSEGALRGKRSTLNFQH
jgi:hypothetical protein